MNLMELIRSAVWYGPSRYYHMAEQALAENKYVEVFTGVSLSVVCAGISIILIFILWVYFMKYSLMLLILWLQSVNSFFKKGSDSKCNSNKN